MPTHSLTHFCVFINKPPRTTQGILTIGSQIFISFSTGKSIHIQSLTTSHTKHPFTHAILTWKIFFGKSPQSGSPLPKLQGLCRPSWPPSIQNLSDLTCFLQLFSPHHINHPPHVTTNQPTSSSISYQILTMLQFQRFHLYLSPTIRLHNVYLARSFSRVQLIDCSPV